MDLVKAVVEASRVIHIDGGSCNCFRKLLACLTIIRRHFAVYFSPLRGGSREKGCMARIVSSHSAFGKRNDSRVTRWSSRNAFSFSSAVTMNLFPLSRCASATKIVCPLESTSDTQPQLQPALLRLSAMISQNFIGTQMRMSESVNSRQSKNLSRESTGC